MPDIVELEARLEALVAKGDADAIEAAFETPTSDWNPVLQLTAVALRLARALRRLDEWNEFFASTAPEKRAKQSWVDKYQQLEKDFVKAKDEALADWERLLKALGDG